MNGEKKIEVKKEGTNLHGKTVNVPVRYQLTAHSLAEKIGDEIFTSEYNRIVVSWKMNFAGFPEKINISLFLDVHRVERLIECYIKDGVFESIYKTNQLVRKELDKTLFSPENFIFVAEFINESINKLVEKKSLSLRIA